MSRRQRQRLDDILAAVDAIATHLERGDLSDGLVFDAVRVRLIEIGEAVKDLPPDLLAHEPSIPWSEVARMRDHLAHATSTPRMQSCRAPSTTTFPNSPPRSYACFSLPTTERSSRPHAFAAERVGGFAKRCVNRRDDLTYRSQMRVAQDLRNSSRTSVGCCGQAGTRERPYSSTNDVPSLSRVRCGQDSSGLHLLTNVPPHSLCASAVRTPSAVYAT